MGGKEVLSSEEGAPNGSNGKEQGSHEQDNQQQPEDADEQQKQQKQLYDQWVAMNGSVMGMNNGALGFDGMNGGFPNMGLNSPADFSQMMNFMPNGMQNNLMGAFPNMMCESNVRGAYENPLINNIISNAGNGFRSHDHDPGYVRRL